MSQSSFESDDYSQIKLQNYSLFNNVWGKGKVTQYHQSLHANHSTDRSTIGWSWSWPKTQSQRVKAFPEVIFGHHPFHQASTTTSLPIQLSDLSVLSAHLSIQKSTFEGKGNLAFDLWFSTGVNPSRKTIALEIMIWLNNYNFELDCLFDERTLINGQEFEVWYASNWKWPYLAFVQQDENISSKMCLHSFIQYAKKKNIISDATFLSSIELGNEIVYGTGEIQFLNYYIQVNDIQILN